VQLLPGDSVAPQVLETTLKYMPPLVTEGAPEKVRSLVPVLETVTGCDDGSGMLRKKLRLVGLTERSLLAAIAAEGTSATAQISAARAASSALRRRGPAEKDMRTKPLWRYETPTAAKARRVRVM
jgi:hypothetical protein